MKIIEGKYPPNIYVLFFRTCFPYDVFDKIITCILLKDSVPIARYFIYFTLTYAAIVCQPCLFDAFSYFAFLFWSPTHKIALFRARNTRHGCLFGALINDISVIKNKGRNIRQVRILNYILAFDVKPELLVFSWRHSNSNYKTVDPTGILL